MLYLVEAHASMERGNTIDAELMYVLTWFTGTEPTFTPVMRPEVYGEAIEHAKRIDSPPV